MKIATSLDWIVCSNELRSQLDNLPYNNDLHKMLKNIEKMVGELSKLEVTARRIRNTKFVENNINEINSAINHLEKLILIATLMR